LGERVTGGYDLFIKRFRTGDVETGSPFKRSKDIVYSISGAGVFVLPMKV